MKSIGTDLVNILPPMDMFNRGRVNREDKKQTVFQKLLVFFERFFAYNAPKNVNIELKNISF
ncbi:MAG: hypothetical protein ACOX56_00840 [Acholeplasmataceae bacterium]|jgi:hypothetical protein